VLHKPIIMFVVADPSHLLFLQHLHVHVLPRKSEVVSNDNATLDAFRDRPERSLAEMSEEASMLRPFF
jgi:diadenosine tetraphosphate (Ap4A) HIT family hydrolase